MFLEVFNFSVFFPLIKNSALKNLNSTFSSCSVFSKHSNLNTEVVPNSTQTKYILQKYHEYTGSLRPKHDL